MHRWNCLFGKLSGVLAKIHSLWPEANLYISNRNRTWLNTRDRARDPPMDTNLLSSPQLYGLDYTVLSDQGKFPVLYQILTRSKLRILHIDVNRDLDQTFWKLQRLLGGAWCDH